MMHGASHQTPTWTDLLTETRRLLHTEEGVNAENDGFGNIPSRGDPEYMCV